jgi:hypothetical protein
MNVKGSIFITLVKVIKADKTGVYNKYLTNKDREIIQRKVLPSSWYPYETYQHCLKAVFEVVAKNDLNVAKEWGRLECQVAMTTVYQVMVKGKDPLSFLKSYQFFHRSFYDFSRSEVDVEGTNQAVWKLHDFDTTFAAVYYLIQGWLEHGMELCGAKNVKSVFLTKSWEGHPFTSMRFTWNM